MSPRAATSQASLACHGAQPRRRQLQHPSEEQLQREAPAHDGKERYGGVRSTPRQHANQMQCRHREWKRYKIKQARSCLRLLRVDPYPRRVQVGEQHLAQILTIYVSALPHRPLFLSLLWLRDDERNVL